MSDPSDARSQAEADELDRASKTLLSALPNLTPEHRKEAFAKLAQAYGIDFGDNEDAWRSWLEERVAERRSGRKPTLSFSVHDIPPNPRILADLLRIAVEAEESPSADEETRPRLPRGYKLLAKIGEGGMGTVYKAEQMSLGRTVAVKFLAERFGRDGSFVERFIREAKMAAALSHPNIVAAIDVGESGGKYYFAMEYVEGQSLGAILRREEEIPEKRALEITAQIAKALDYAQRRGLIHRDVKPDNILIDEEGAAKLADMGLARSVSGADEEGRITPRSA